MVFERISTSIELNVLNMLVFGAELEIEGLEDFNSSLSGVQSKYLVFLATLGRRRGELLALLIQIKFESKGKRKQKCNGWSDLRVGRFASPVAGSPACVCFRFRFNLCFM